MGKYNALINKLWPGDAGEASRVLAHKFIAKFGEMPMAADRVEPALYEAARLDQLVAAGTIEQTEANAALDSFFIEGLGTPPHVLAEYRAFTEEIAAELAETPTAQPEQPPTEQPAPPAAVAPPRTVGPSREQMEAEVAKWQAAMREPQGSEGWKSYWRGPGQQALLSALQGLEAADAAPPLPAVAGGAAAPAPEQPAEAGN